VFTSRYSLRARTQVNYDESDNDEKDNELAADAYVPSDDDEEEEDGEDAEEEDKEEESKEKAAEKPKPAKKSSKKATKRDEDEVRVGPKRVQIYSQVQKDAKNRKAVERRRVKSGGHGNAGGYKSDAFLKGYSLITKINGQVLRSMLHFKELHERFDLFLSKNEKVEMTLAKYSAEFKRVPLYSKKRSARAQKRTILKVGGKGAKQPVALRILYKNATEFWLVAMFESVRLAEKMMNSGQGRRTISAVVNEGGTGLSGKYLGDFCHWKLL